MAPDFHDAHHRHWEDAELLLENNRLANADHLYGMAAECGLKRLMIVFGMTLDNDIPPPCDRVHANEIWVRYDAYRTGHVYGDRFPLSNINPFHNWRAAQRYDNRSGYNLPYVTPHRNGAQTVQKLLQKALLEGIL